MSSKATWVLLLSVSLLVGMLAAQCPPSAPPTPTSPPPPPTATPKAPEPTKVSEPTTVPEPTKAPEPTTAPTPVEPTAAPAAMEILTLSFEPGGDIPTKYTCMGDNMSPLLKWTGAPAATQSLVLLVYDLDAGADSGASTPLGFAHWIVYNIPPSTPGYTEGMPAGDTLADGALQGSNDFAQFEKPGATFPGGAPVKLVGYDGPCPGAKHRYTFNIYALDTRLDLPAAATMAQVLKAMEGHVLAQAELVGSYAPSQ